MVWKIFAPRLLFAASSLVVIDTTAILALCIVSRLASAVALTSFHEPHQHATWSSLSMILLWWSDWSHELCRHDRYTPLHIVQVDSATAQPCSYCESQRDDTWADRFLYNQLNVVPTLTSAIHWSYDGQNMCDHPKLQALVSPRATCVSQSMCRYHPSSFDST